MALQTFRPMSLPWPTNALKPFMSEKAMQTHYDDIYLGYVNKMNAFVGQYPELQSLTLAEIVTAYTYHIRDTAAQILNHEFFYRSLRGGADGGVPSDRLYRTIVQQFKSFESFVLQFTQKAVDHFASGWIWLVYDPTTAFLRIVDGDNAYNPMMDGQIPLLALDVWEHAYLLDYGSDKKSYVNNFWKVVNWTHVEQIASESIFNYQVRVK